MDKNRMLKLLEGALDYTPVVITVLFAAVASLIATSRDTTAEELLQWTLAVLALMATTQLIDRFRILRSLEDRVDRLASRNRESVTAGDFFVQTRPDLQQRLRQARSIAISGVSLARTSVSLWPILQERLERRVPIRVLLLDPDHSAADVASYRIQRHQDPVRIKAEIRHALGNFAALSEQKPELRETFELRLLPYAIPCGIWIIDDGAKAEIWVEMYTFRETVEPTFHLLPHRDGEWFTLFERQFEKMWDVSKPWAPDSAQSESIPMPDA